MSHFQVFVKKFVVDVVDVDIDVVDVDVVDIIDVVDVVVDVELLIWSVLALNRGTHSRDAADFGKCGS